MGILSRLLNGGDQYEQYPEGEPIRNRRELRERSGPGVTVVNCPCGQQFSYPGRSGGFTCPSCKRRHN